MKSLLSSIFSFVVFLLCFQPVFSEDLPVAGATVEGTIKSSDSLAPIPYVSVYLEKTTIGSISNGRGFFRLKNVPAGEYTLVASTVGYETVRMALSVNSGSDVYLMDIQLKESLTNLPPIVIQSATLTGGLAGIRDVPGSAYYVSPKEIQKLQYTDINRALMLAPGVNIQEEEGFGLRPSIGLRGSGIDRAAKITLMEDGILIAPAPYSAPAAYYFPTVGRLSGIEVLKGSSQIKYGPYTTGGAINLLSTDIPKDFSGNIRLLAGNFGYRELHANAGNSHKNVAYMAETFQHRSTGFKELDNDGNTGFNKADYLAKVRVNTNPDARIYQSLTVKAGQVTERSDETYLGLTRDDFQASPFRRYAASQADVINTTHRQYSVRHAVIFPKNFTLTTIAYQNNFSRNWYKLDKVKDSTGAVSIATILDNPERYAMAYQTIIGENSPGSKDLEVKANNRAYRSRGIQSSLGYSMATGSLKHDVEFSIRYHEDYEDRFQWVDKYAMDQGIMKLTEVGIPGTDANRIEQAEAWAGFLSYRLNWKGLTIIPGLRYENIWRQRLDYGKADSERTGSKLTRVSNKMDIWIPGIALDYKFNHSTGVFTGVHKGFAPAGTKEGSLPEESINFEFGVRHGMNGFNGQAVLFYTLYRNLLGSDFASSGGLGTGDVFNGGEALSRGLELSLAYDLLSNVKSSFSLPLNVSYTYTDARFTEGFKSDFEEWGTVVENDRQPYIAPHQMAFSLSLEHYRFQLHLNGRFMDRMRTTPGQGKIDLNTSTDRYFIMDAGASITAHKNISFFGSVNNLFDNVYVVALRPAGLRPGIGRFVKGGIRVNF